MSDVCYACGRTTDGNYCPNCGAKQTKVARAHHNVLRSEGQAARKACEQAKHHRRLYGGVDGADLPPAKRLVPAAAKDRAKADGLYPKRVIDRALDLFTE